MLTKTLNFPSAATLSGAREHEQEKNSTVKKAKIKQRPITNSPYLFLHKLIPSEEYFNIDSSLKRIFMTAGH
jgi:hypothetical protein